MVFRLFQKLLLLSLLFGGFASVSLADFYVIPVAKKIKNVVIVAKSGGDFTDVKAAMDSITDANATHPYLIFVGPGVYTLTETLQLKAYVTLKGSGEKTTLLTGAISILGLSNSAIIFGADNATLSDLSVENTGGSTYSVGIYNTNSSPTLNNVTVTAFGGTYSYGIYNNFYSSPILTNVTVTASGGSTTTCGIANYATSSPTLNNVTVTASGGTNCYGVYNYNSSSSTLTNVTVTALGGSSSNYGILNNNSSSKIYYSKIRGDTDDVSGGARKCVYSVGNSDIALDALCN